MLADQLMFADGFDVLALVPLTVRRAASLR